MSTSVNVERKCDDVTMIQFRVIYYVDRIIIDVASKVITN